MRYLKHLQYGLLILVFPTACLAQNRLPDTSNKDTDYFDFWPGTWYMEVDGKMDTTATKFVVEQGVNEWTYEETWVLVYPESNSIYKARGIRGWSPTTQSWPYIWMGESGFFQQWEGRKVDGHWYIYKHFNINGDKYLSRQAWIPESNGTRLMRISEKSYDEGKTWELRFKEYYQKKL